MIRKAFTLYVHPEKVTEYIRVHNPVRAEMLAMLKAHGVSNYSIHLAPDNATLFGYAEVDDEAQWNAIAATPECQRWWADMAPLMRTNPDNSPVSTDLREVFYLA